MTPLSVLATVAFATLTVAVLTLWMPLVTSHAHAHRLWLVPAGIALVIAGAAGLVNLTGALVLLAFGGLCVAARRVPGRIFPVLAHVLVLSTCAALFLHIVPGFDNPRLISNALTGSDAQPYTKYLNFDKGMAGLILLGLYAPRRAHRGMPAPAFLWRFVVLIGVVTIVTLATGYVRWDPKLPEWWLSWLWSMVFLTALPEEALFRGCVQTWIAERLAATRGGRTASGARLSVMPASIIIAGLLFGLAHAGGGPAYVVLATVAGIGYGWVYSVNGSIGAAILAHAGLNTVHLLLFTYPALATITGRF